MVAKAPPAGGSESAASQPRVWGAPIPQTPPSRVPWAGLLFGAYLALYLALGSQLAGTGVFSLPDRLFGADTPRVVKDLTDPGGRHWRTEVHPLFVLFTNPVGTALKRVVQRVPRSCAPSGDAALSASLVLVAICGAAGVALAYRLFLMLGMRWLEAILYANLLALSTTHLVFSAIPETHIFAELTLILLVVVASWQTRWADSVPSGHPIGTAWMWLAGVLAMGVTVTNLIQAMVIEFFGTPRCKGAVARLRCTLVFLIPVLAVAVVLSIVQQLAYHNSELFFVPGMYRDEKTWLFHPQGPGDVARRAAALLCRIFVYNIVAPRPIWWQSNTWDSSPLPYVSFRTWPEYGAAGVVACALWVLLVCYALFAPGRVRSRHRQLQVALAVCVLANLALHLAYGDDLFLYSANWTFFVIALVALRTGDAPSARARRIHLVLLSAAVAAMGVSNGLFAASMVQRYHRAAATSRQACAEVHPGACRPTGRPVARHLMSLAEQRRG